MEIVNRLGCRIKLCVLSNRQVLGYALDSKTGEYLFADKHQRVARVQSSEGFIPVDRMLVTNKMVFNTMNIININII